MVEIESLIDTSLENSYTWKKDVVLGSTSPDSRLVFSETNSLIFFSPLCPQGEIDMDLGRLHVNYCWIIWPFCLISIAHTNKHACSPNTNGWTSSSVMLRQGLNHRELEETWPDWAESLKALSAHTWKPYTKARTEINSVCIWICTHRPEAQT